MEIVTVKNKFQIVIPQHIRERVRIEVGDILEAGFEDGKITFTPKSLEWNERNPPCELPVRHVAARASVGAIRRVGASQSEPASRKTVKPDSAS